MIRIRHLTIGWGSTVLMKDLDFEIKRGEIFAILGGSGSGKTTLMRHMIGLATPMRGRVEIEGVTLPQRPDRPPAFGVMFQSGALFGSMTLLENVALPLRKWTDLSDDAIESIALARLRVVDLGGFEHFMPAELSGGMRKRAGIARALALEPELVFLDEPSAGLDPVTAVEFDDLMLSLRERLGLTVVIVTHELESIFRVADRCIMLDKQARGPLAIGDPHELRHQKEPERMYRFFNRLPSDSQSN